METKALIAGIGICTLDSSHTYLILSFPLQINNIKEYIGRQHMRLLYH